jgi:hypothetical protein
MNRLRALLILLGFLFAFPTQADDVIRLRPAAAHFTLQENATTGYSGGSIRTRAKASTSSRFQTPVGGASRRMVAARAAPLEDTRVKPGHAEIVFAYQRP